MRFFKLLAVGVVALNSGGAFAGCAYENDVPIKSLSAGFEAWKAVTDAMAECGKSSSGTWIRNFDHQKINVAGMQGDPAEPYSRRSSVPVSNGTLHPAFR